jgi:hypothetical protein
VLLPGGDLFLMQDFGHIFSVQTFYLFARIWPKPEFCPLIAVCQGQQRLLIIFFLESF